MKIKNKAVREKFLPFAPPSIDDEEIKKKKFIYCHEPYTAKEIVQTYCKSKNAETKVLILLEHEEHVKDCLEWLDEIKYQKTIIALSPFAIYELDRQDISYHIPEDYYDPQELYRLGIDNFQKVEEICSVIDKYIHEAYPSTAKLGIDPALFSIYYLKVLYDATTIRLFQLFKLIDAEKPDVIFIYGSKEYPFGISEMAPYLLFDNRESIYAHILALDGWKVPVVMFPAISQPEDSYAQREKYQTISDRLKKKAVGWLQTHPKLFDLAIRTQKRGWHGFFSGLKSYLHANKNMPVLLFGGGYNWDDCGSELQSMGIGPIIRMRDNLKDWMSNQFSLELNFDAIHATWEELKVDDEFRKFFLWRGIDFFPALEERLRFLIEYMTTACLKAYEEAEELLKNRGFEAVISSGFNTCTSHPVSQAARNAGIPVISWQLGACYIEHKHLIYSDLMGSDMHFYFGEGVVEKYAEPARRFGTKIIAVGSTSLEALTRKIRQNKAERVIKLVPEKKVVLYVTTNFYQNDLYISYYPPFSDNQLWSTQRAIIDVLGKHNDYATVIKTHQNIKYRETPMRSYAKEKGFENCQFIRNECSFTDLLTIADIIVIDVPSTVLLQSLTTKKPIFVLLKHLKIDDDARDLLKRRAYCYQDLYGFTKALDTFLSSGSTDTQVDLTDREFLKMHGTHLDDGKSGVRAADILRKIIDQRK